MCMEHACRKWEMCVLQSLLNYSFHHWLPMSHIHSLVGRSIMASPKLKRHLSSRPRERGSHENSTIRELDRGQIVFVFSVEGTVTLELALSATLDTVPRPPYRACYHSLSRLKDTYIVLLMAYNALNIS